MSDQQPKALALADALLEDHPFPLNIKQAAAELRRLHQAITFFEQSITDPENQPSQYGTVPLEWYLRHEALLKQAVAALEKNTKHLPVHFDSHFEAITAIRARLEPPPKQA